MKEIKDCQLKFRLTTELKNKIADYCERYDINTSEFIRMACERIFDKRMEDDLK
jgi:antitoxin component of RelBE/YafQ-DinJ toxin-antitoxin module